MASRSLIHWQTLARRSLDEVEAALTAVAGRGPGRRYATQQINHAYVVLLSPHFQAFCRDIHSEAVDVLAAAVTNPLISRTFRDQLTANRRLDFGNPNPGNLGSDFARIDMAFWTDNPGACAAPSPANGKA